MNSLRPHPFFIKVPDGKLHLGDIVISYPTALKQAGEHNHPVNREIAILLIHGILHLLGYDHDVPVRAENAPPGSGHFNNH